jgi:hypothetical protein
MDTQTALQDLYSWPGFRACGRLQQHPLDPLAKVILLRRRQKKVSAPAAARRYAKSVPGARTWFGIWMLPGRPFTCNSNTVGSNARIAEP